MTPSARLQAAMELLDEIIVAARDNGSSADNIAKKYFKARRYAGSKDRRAIREHVYVAVRRWGERPENGREAMIGLATEHSDLRPLFDGSAYGPAAIGADEPFASGTQIPAWLEKRFAGLIDESERTALFDRAPLHIRVNPRRERRGYRLDLAGGPRAVSAACLRTAGGDPAGRQCGLSKRRG